VARIGRGRPNVVIIRRGAQHVPADLELDLFDLAAEWPEVTVASPDIRIELGVFDLAAEWPDLLVSREETFTLDAFDLAAEWPALTVDIPVRAGDLIELDGQVEFARTLWGQGTSFRISEITGWESLPELDNRNSPRPNTHGAYRGRKVAQQRIVGIRMVVESFSDPEGVQPLVKALRRATRIYEEPIELDLAIRTYGETLRAKGHVIDREINLDGDWSVGAANAAVLIACSDPRRYDLYSASASLPKDVEVTVENEGDVETHPIIKIPGPSTNPVLTNSTSGKLIGFDLILAGGEELEVDTWAGTARVDGALVNSSLSGFSLPIEDWTLSPDESVIEYTTDSGGSTPPSLLWSHAYL
jgi:hypothetical protein